MGNRIHIDRITINVIVGMFVMLTVVSSGLFYLAREPPASPVGNPVDISEPAFNASDHSPSTTEPVNLSFENKQVGFNFSIPEATVPEGDFTFPGWLGGTDFFKDTDGDGLPDPPSPYSFTVWDKYTIWNEVEVDSKVTVLTIQGGINLDVFDGHFLPNVAQDWSYMETLFEPAPPVVSALLLIFPMVFVMVIIRAIEVGR